MLFRNTWTRHLKLSGIILLMERIIHCLIWFLRYIILWVLRITSHWGAVSRKLFFWKFYSIFLNQNNHVLDTLVPARSSIVKLAKRSKYFWAFFLLESPVAWLLNTWLLNWTNRTPCSTSARRSRIESLHKQAVYYRITNMVVIVLNSRPASLFFTCLKHQGITKTPFFPLQLKTINNSYLLPLKESLKCKNLQIQLDSKSYISLKSLVE